MNCIIVGCGGHGRVVLDVLTAAGEHDVAGFVDSNPALFGRRVDGKPVYGNLSVLDELKRTLDVDAAVVAIGNNGIRREFSARCE